MDLLFLGTGNAFGHSGRLNSSYLLQGDKSILIDCGPAILSALRSNKLSVKDIDFILLSHLHPDHYLGLPQIVLEDYYVIKRENKIPVYCPVGTRDKIHHMAMVMYNQEIADHSLELFEFIETNVGDRSITEWGTIEYLEANHSGNARMMLLETEGRTLGYTGDSSYHEQSFKRLLTADIVICEASSAGFKIPDHMTMEEVLNLDLREGSKLYLSHLGQSVIDRKNEIKPPFYLAEDNMRISI